MLFFPLLCFVYLFVVVTVNTINSKHIHKANYWAMPCFVCMLTEDFCRWIAAIVCCRTFWFQYFVSMLWFSWRLRVRLFLLLDSRYVYIPYGIDWVIGMKLYGTQNICAQKAVYPYVQTAHFIVIHVPKVAPNGATERKKKFPSKLRMICQWLFM